MVYLFVNFNFNLENALNIIPIDNTINIILNILV